MTTNIEKQEVFYHFTRKIPKYQLGKFPTRLLYHERLSEELGIHLYIKMESEADYAGTGNKVRKLEYLLKEAELRGSQTLIADGITQSNCCYAVATYGKRLGFHVRLLYIGTPSQYGNYLKARLTGASCDHIPVWSYENVENGIRKIQEEETAQGQSYYYIPTGGTSATGVLGSIDLAVELSKQEEALGIQFDAIVYPSGTGGTQLGMAIGKHCMGKEHWNLHPVAVANNQEIFTEICRKYSEDLIEQYDFPADILDIEHDVFMGALGKGYKEIEQEDIHDLVKSVRDTGIYFDSTYNYKTLKGLKLMVQQGRIHAGSHVVLIHTGGTNESFAQDGDLQEKFLQAMEV